MRQRIALFIGVFVLSNSALFAQYTGGIGGGYAGTVSAAGWASTSTSTISAANPSITANGVSTTLVTVQLKDALGSNLTVGGDSLALTTTMGSLGPVADHGDGTYTATLTSGAVVGFDTVRASVDAHPMANVAVVQFTLAIPKTIAFASGNGQSKTVFSLLDSAFVVTVRDSAGVIAPNATVLFAVTSKPSGATGDSLTVTSATTDFKGQASTVLRLGTKSGTYQVQATSSGLTGSPVTFTATGTPGAVSLSQSTVSVARTSIASGDTTFVTLLAKDANGNRLTGGGLTVAFGLGAGTSSGTFAAVADSGNGKYTSVFTGTTSGTARSLTSTINSSAVTSTMPTVTVTPGAVSLSQSTVSVARTSIASGDTTFVTLIAKDANGNRLTGGGLTVAFGLGAGTSSGTFAAVADSGNGKYTSVFTGTTSGTARTLSATINSSSVTSTMPTVTVTPGAVSLSQSTVTRARSSIASGDTTFVTLIAKDANGNRLTGGGLTVAFGLGAGTSSGTYATVADSGNGKYTSVFTGTTSGTARTLSATINSSSVTSTMPTVTVTPGAVSLSQSTVSVARTSIASGDTTFVTLIAKDANGNRLTGGGLTVAFGLGAGTSSGTYATVADSGNGKYTSVFTGTTSGTARTLSATINSSAVTSTMPTVTVTPGAVSLSQSTVSVARTSIASGDTTFVTLIAKDANGNRLTGGGLTVAFGLGAGTSSGTYATVADSGNGKYTSVFTGTASGTARSLTATINSSSVTSTMPTVTVTPGAVSLGQSTVSVARTSIASGDTTFVTLIAKDANGNRLTGGGLTVAFGLGAGTSSGTFAAVADSGNGKYTSVFTGTTSGTARSLTATINSSSVTSAMPSVTVTPGAVSLSQSTVTRARSSIASGDTTFVTLIAKDANGNRLTGGGLTVAFGLGAGTSSGTYATVADSGNGKYTSIFTGTTSGTARTLSATINSSAVTSTMPTVTVTPGAVSLSQSTVSVARTSIASGDTTFVTLIAKDANGNRLTGGGLTVAFGLGAGTSSGTFATVADSGNGKYTSVFTGTTSGTARTLSATVNSSSVTSTMPTVTVTPGAVSLSQSTVSVARASIASGDTTFVTLIAKDANGNRLTGGGLTVAFGLGAGTSSGTYATVADSGNGKYTSVFTGTTSGTARTLSATINSSAVTSTMPTVTVTPGAVSLSQSTVSVARTSIASGDTTFVTLIAKDANGNRLTGGGLTVAFGLGAGTSSGTYATVADSGNGKYTSVFTGTTSGTARTLSATINSSAVTSTMPAVTVKQSGLHLSVSTINVGTVSLGIPKDTIVTVSNIGNDTLRVLSINSSNPAFVSRLGAFIVPPGQAAVDTIRFTGSAIGPASASLSVVSNAPTSPDTLRVSGYAVGTPVFSVNHSFIQFGSVTVGAFRDTTVTVMNTGTDTLKVTNVSASDIAFSIRTRTFAVAPGGSFTDTVRYAPVAPGSLSAFFLVANNASALPDTVKLSGFGVVYTASLSWHSASVGKVRMGQFRDTVVTVTNTGNDTLRVTGIVSSNPAFTSRRTVFVVAPGQFVKDTLRYTPSTPGADSARIVVSWNASPASDTLKVFGFGTTYSLQFSTKTLVFGEVAKSAFKDTTILITNAGNDTVLVSNTTLTSALFTVRKTSWALAPSQSFVDTIRYAPTALGTINAKMIITSNASTSPDTVLLSGTTTTGVVHTEGIPTTFSISQNYPNPFNPATTIRFAVPVRSNVRLEVFNIIGQRVAELVNGEMSAGFYEKSWRWEGASGLYIYRIEASSVDNPGNHFVAVRKMMLIK